MWGTWFILTVGGTIGLIVLGLGLALSAWSPIFAVIAFVAVAVVLVGFAALRRSTEYVKQDEGRHPQHPADVVGAAAEDRGAPAGGEGGAGDREPAATPPSPGAPERAS